MDRGQRVTEEKVETATLEKKRLDMKKTLRTHYNSREFPDRRSFLGNVEMWDEKTEITSS